MKIALITLAFIVGGIVLVGGVLTMWGVGQYNTASTLRNQYQAKDKANEAVFDNMWKKIAQSAEVTDAQKHALKEIFTGYAQARTGNQQGGGTFINAVHEAIPNVDTSVFRNLQNIITGARDEWTANQIALVDIAREYNLMLVKFPSNILLSMLGFQKIDPRVITSSRTEAVYATGKDDDVGLGLKK